MAVPVNTMKNNAQTTPEEIQKFLDNAVMGAVYVNFGSCSISQETLNVIIKSFGQLKQSIIWEYEIIPDNLPSNIMIRNHLPQNSILAHTNVQLLITNGDTSVLKLALFYGIPMLIIPFENNQLHSAINCTALENVSMLRSDDVTETTLSCKLNTMLNDEKYKIRAKEISKLLQQKTNHDCTKWKESIALQKERNSSAVHLHFDALGGLFFVIFVVVKVSLKFCQFYNSWLPSKLTKKTK